MVGKRCIWWSLLNNTGLIGLHSCCRPREIGRTNEPLTPDKILPSESKPAGAEKHTPLVPETAWVIETHSLTKRFGRLTAVDGLTLAVSEGQVFGLLGPNGAGKSTLMKMLVTLLPPTSGTAKLAGYDLLGQPALVRRSIGYVPQLLSADGMLTGYENLRIFAQLYDLPRKERAARIDQAMTSAGLHDAAHHLGNTYSGDMIRRLEVVSAMLHRPRVLFLDEPTVGRRKGGHSNLQRRGRRGSERCSGLPGAGCFRGSGRRRYDERGCNSGAKAPSFAAVLSTCGAACATQGLRPEAEAGVGGSDRCLAAPAAGIESAPGYRAPTASGS